MSDSGSRAREITSLQLADTLPFFATALSEVPSPTNRLGVRSGGEGGTTPALAAVINAIVDALAELGVRHIEMPATPEREWRAIRCARVAVACAAFCTSSSWCRFQCSEPDPLHLVLGEPLLRAVVQLRRAAGSRGLERVAVSSAGNERETRGRG